MYFIQLMTGSRSRITPRHKCNKWTWLSTRHKLSKHQPDWRLALSFKICLFLQTQTCYIILPCLMCVHRVCTSADDSRCQLPSCSRAHDPELTPTQDRPAGDRRRYRRYVAFVHLDHVLVCSIHHAILSFAYVHSSSCPWGDARARYGPSIHGSTPTSQVRCFCIRKEIIHYFWYRPISNACQATCRPGTFRVVLGRLPPLL